MGEMAVTMWTKPAETPDISMSMFMSTVYCILMCSYNDDPRPLKYSVFFAL